MIVLSDIVLRFEWQMSVANQSYNSTDQSQYGLMSMIR